MAFLIKNGLRQQYPKSCLGWKSRIDEFNTEFAAFELMELETVKAEISEKEPVVRASLLQALLDHALESFPYA